MGRHARMKRKYKSVDPANPISTLEKKTFLKPPKSDANPNLHFNGFMENLGTNGEKRPKKSKNKFKKNPGETDFRHMQRLSREVQKEIFIAQNTPDYEPELHTVKQTNARKQKQKEKLKTRKQKLKERLQEKLMDKNENFQDIVPFGEVVTAPPRLKSKPRSADKLSGKNNKNLILNQKFKDKPSHVSMARKEILLKERERVIQTYRNIKKQKMADNINIPI